ncbi:MAG: helix-turn-helix domain-containing protein [Oscillospiraceae bacterium]|nr:helix-turn-helix domain-containing protein [Oscillospiraceae bacterium]
MTQKALAEVLYVSHRTISSWELDKTEPDITSIIKLSALFHASLNYLLIGESKNTL